MRRSYEAVAAVGLHKTERRLLTAG